VDSVVEGMLGGICKMARIIVGCWMRNGRK